MRIYMSVVEKYYPLALAALAGVSVWCFDLLVVNNTALIISIFFGAVVAWFAAGVLLVLALLQGTVVQQVQKAGYMQILRSSIRDALLSGVAVYCVSFSGLVLEISESLLAGLDSAAMVFCLACFYRLVSVMLRMFGHAENLLHPLDEPL